MKRALIITYYWPPSGGAGVYRWLKFSRYMKEFGWKPVIYTPLNPTVPSNDPSLLEDVPDNIEVIKQGIFEPLELYNKLLNRKNKKVGAGMLTSVKTAGWKSKLLFWIRGNLFIPDPRKFWIRPSVRYLTRYLKTNPVDVIISTGPPHSMHIIAMKVAAQTKIKWVADFRDPWTNIDYYHQLNLTGFADKKNKRLEGEVLKNAGLITTVSKNWAKEFRELGAQKVEIITNGYDREEFSTPPDKINKKFTYTHIGSMNNDRNPAILWKSFAELVKVQPELNKTLEIKLIGDVDYRVFEAIDENGLSDFLVHIPYLEHKKVIEELWLSSVLLLPLNNTPNVSGIIPGKLFEYLAVMKPILAIGPEDGDTASIIDETNSGTTVNYKNEEKLIRIMHEIYLEYKSGETRNLIKNNKTEKYSRENLCKDYCTLLDKLTTTNVLNNE